MVLDKFLNRFKNRNASLKQAQDLDRVKHLVQERKKNSNERELEKFHEMERQKRIKAELENYRNKQRDEYWRGKNVLHAPDVIKDKNMFAGNKATVMQGEGMFFK